LEANWSELSKRVAWWGILLALVVRFAFMGFIFFVYLRFRKAAKASDKS
jgi:predicted tellurium resistance membrane protein TerC